MQHRKGWILGTATGLLIVVSFGNADAEHTRRDNGKFAGTFLSTRMDIVDRGDGVIASWGTGVVTGTLGRRTFQAIAEPKPTGVTVECPGGVYVIDAANAVGFGRATHTFPNGDQIYTRVLMRTQCGVGGGKFVADETHEITGGTGKFEGASGTAEVHFISLCQVFDPNAVPPQCFGSHAGEFTGTITLP